MATSQTARRPRRHTPADSVGKPRDVLHPRGQQLGPERFGILCFDCAKARSKFLLADFYGTILIPPTTVAHNRIDLDAAIAQVRQAFADHHLGDGLVAIEPTGRYHRLVQRAFASAGFETRILQDQGGGSAGPPDVGRHPADRVGAPGSGRGTIDRVKGVDLRRVGSASPERLLSPRVKP